jgi:hypothetical protein
MKKKIILIAVFCAVLLSPARGFWSYKYWYCPVSWSEAKVYFQVDWTFDPEFLLIYVAGEGPLPDSNEENTIELPFQYAHGHLPSSRLPWRQRNGDLDKIVFDFGATGHIGDIRIVKVDEGITHIGNWWFAGLYWIKEAAMPLSLQSIGEGAFKGCGELLFFECSDKVKSIGSRAFEGCSNLHEFNVYDPTGNYKISEDPLSIGSGAFTKCKNLKYFNITANSTLGDKVFSESGLESITIPNNVTIGKDAFHGCKNLKSITFQGKINANTEGMFQGCSSLTSVNIPNGVTAIGANAFNGCSSLQTVNIPNGVTSIGDCAFDRCYVLPSVNIPNGVTTIGNDAFLWTGLISVTIPNSVTKIGQQAFNSTGLTSITVPGSVKNIEYATFAFCKNLTSVKICEGVKTVGKWAFQECRKLEKVILPASLDSIAEWIFRDCNSLKVIECNSTTPLTVNANVFAGTDLTKISVFVPYGSVEAYKNAPVWKEFKHIGTYPAGLQLDKHSITTKGNTTVKLNAYLIPHDAVPSVEWSTKNINVAEVNNGVVKFKSPGTAAIVATSHNGIFRDSCFIRVLEDNIDGRPTFADSLLGEWIECDENLQDVPNPEIFGFWKTVTTSPEGYQTISLNCRYNNGAVERTVDGFSIDEVTKVVYVHTTVNTTMYFTVIKLTNNTVTIKNIRTGNIEYFKRVK